MRIQHIELTNWQSYRGSGKQSTKIDFNGANGEKNCILYGQNTHGKTAIWQAIRFALYGRVNKRMAGWREGKYKPIVASETALEPLLNVPSHDSGDYTVGVRLGFEHKGMEYLIDRSYTNKRNVSIPRRSDQMEETFTIRNLDKGSFVQEKKQFIEDILPENLARFFMFDGERLDEYRGLFEDTKDVELKGFIEAILRFPVLTDGVTDFEKIQKSLKKEISSHAVEHNKGKKAAELLAESKSELEAEEETLDDYKGDLGGYQEELAAVNEWLKDRESGKAVLQQQTMYEKERDEAIEKIEQTEKRMSSHLPGSWRAIISTKIESRLDGVEEEIARQREQTERISEIKIELQHLNNKLEGKECSTCRTQLEVPSDNEKEDITKKIVSFEKEMSDLEITRIDPEPAYLYRRATSLQNLKSDMKLDMLLDLEKDLLSWKSKKRKAEQNYEKASKMLSNKAKKEVAEKLLKQEELLKKIGKVEGRIGDKKIVIKDIEYEIEKYQDQLGSGGGKKTAAYRKAEIKSDLVRELKSEWESVTETHREEQRKNVEERSSKVFMSLSNKSKAYKGLKIYEDFQIAIIDDKGKRDAGSSGQWGLLAYSVLDALTTCSGITFPLVIDTPGASIDDNHLTALFDYLFTSGKQVILLPEGTELKPDAGDEQYGHTCSATYQLSLNEDDITKTDVLLRVNNLEGS